MSHITTHIGEQMSLNGLTPTENRLLVAVSGGVDSVCLLRVLLRLGYDCVAAHCNFHLRGDESDRDECFVRTLCRALDVPLHVGDFDVAAHCREHGVSVEMACRALRYDWFERLRVDCGCSHVAVAHHADDNIETFFLNLLRGTGMDGLAGMKPVSARRVVRPMLRLSRAEILDFLAEMGQDYVTDSTNLANDCRRNVVRNAVLPVLDAHFPDARRRVADAMAHLGDESRLLHHLLQRYAREVGGGGDDGLRLPLSELQQAPEPGMLLFALTRQWGFNRDQCDRAVTSGVGARFDAQAMSMTVGRGHIEVHGRSLADGRELRLDFSRPETFPGWLSVSLNNAPFSRLMVDGKRKVAFAAGLLSARRVVLRHWRRGDRFAPYGMAGSKLLSDLFGDLKLSAAQKNAVWLLEADGVILWVLGHRAARQLLVAPEATDYVLMSIKD